MRAAVTAINATYAFISCCVKVCLQLHLTNQKYSILFLNLRTFLPSIYLIQATLDPKTMIYTKMQNWVEKINICHLGVLGKYFIS